MQYRDNASMSSLPAIQIQKVDHEQDDIRHALIGYLAARETHNLFILGNLVTRFPGSHVYVASRQGKWAGVAGYYQTPKSIIPYSTDPEITRALVRRIRSIHRPVEWLCGVGYAAGPALDELKSCGFAVVNDPRQVFMEAAIDQEADIPHCPHEHLTRFIEDHDGQQLAYLLRHLRRPEDHSPVTDDEIRRFMLNRQRLVIEVDGKLVSTAATNGMGVRAFQIIGVVTLPEYRRRGYAKALCAALMRQVHRQGARRSAIFTDIHNTPAQDCYRSLGFRVSDEYIVAQVRSSDAS